MTATDSPKNIVLKNGQMAVMRPLTPADRDLLQLGFGKLSPETVRKRFLAAKKRF